MYPCLLLSTFLRSTPFSHFLIRKPFCAPFSPLKSLPYHSQIPAPSPLLAPILSFTTRGKTGYAECTAAEVYHEYIRFRRPYLPRRLRFRFVLFLLFAVLPETLRARKDDRIESAIASSDALWKERKATQATSAKATLPASSTTGSSTARSWYQTRIIR